MRGFSLLASRGAVAVLPRARLAALLQDDALRLEGEEQAFDALVAWHDAQAPPPDEADLAGLLSLVRFPLMRAEHVREVVMASPLMGSMAAKDCLTKALLAGYQALDQQLAAARPRKVRAGIGVLLVGGMLSDHTPLGLAEQLLRNSCGGGEWQPGRSLLEPRAGAAAATIGGRLHVAGGTGGSQAPLASTPNPDPSPNPSPNPTPTPTPTPSRRLSPRWSPTTPTLTAGWHELALQPYPSPSP